MTDELREQLADVQHAIWSHWMRYQFSVCQSNGDGSITIPADLVERWSRQMATNYTDLTNKERESDREQADKVLAVLRGSAIVAAPPTLVLEAYLEYARGEFEPLEFGAWLRQQERNGGQP